MPKYKSSINKKKNDDSYLMLLAAAAAIIVGFFAVATYRSKSLSLHPMPTPNTIITVGLNSQNSSYESGIATLEEINGKVVVTLNMKGYTDSTAQPAHIHAGMCPNPGSIKYPLSPVINGKSVTTIDTTLANLKSMLPLAINVHKSASQAGIYISCGDIKF